MLLLADRPTCVEKKELGESVVDRRRGDFEIQNVRVVFMPAAYRPDILPVAGRKDEPAGSYYEVQRNVIYRIILEARHG